MLILKGDYLEGGGQLLRLAAALSSLTSTPIRINNIRGRRPKPGFKSQHLLAIQWLGAACNARMHGDEKGSKQLFFEPGKGTRKPLLEESGEIRIAQGTPGSVGLILQALLPYILFSPTTWLDEGGTPLPVKLIIEGGTNTSFSPSTDYIAEVLLPTLRRIGIPPISMQNISRGWTHGRADVGRVVFTIQPISAGQSLPAFSLRDYGTVSKVTIHIHASNNVRSHIKSLAESTLESMFPGVQIEIGTNADSNHQKRLYLLLVAHSSNGHVLGRDLLWDRKITDPLVAVRKLVSTVTEELQQEIKHGGCVDEYLQDQLVGFQALASGRSIIETSPTRPASLHTQTARWVSEQVLGVKFNDDGNCLGVGFCVGQGYADIVSAETEEQRVAVNQQPSPIL
ncbi:MAG: hypothetical protein M1814_001893 [Vezdaea aestivalis]|nr:MAG: hypothetical protein M1814_001893 [Vezdaea aestivalis]